MPYSTTNKYIQDNEYLKTLKRINISSTLRLDYENRSSFNLIFSRLQELSQIKKYFKEIWLHKNWIRKLINLRSCNKNIDAILIGNGPSQGLINLNLSCNSIIKENIMEFEKNLPYCIINWTYY